MAAIDFVCPRCHGDLVASDTEYRCTPCSATYPIVFGIPDFRVEPDPWLGFEEDRDKARRLLERTEGKDLGDSVRAYWDMTPGTPAEYARRFTEYVLGGEARAAEWLDSIGPASSNAAPWLEIGCASGDLVATAARRGIQVVGVDVAMRWLVLARKRQSVSAWSFPGEGESISSSSFPRKRESMFTMVCANGEFLPFRDSTFSRVVSIGTLEHCSRADDVLSESARVLRPGGDAIMRTTNRFTLLPEPRVNLWGVGFLPRSWADGYVRWRGGQGYLHHRVLSARELLRGMRRAGLSEVKVDPAALLPSDHERLGGAGRLISPMYTLARSLPVLPTIMRWVAPLLEARGRRS